MSMAAITPCDIPRLDTRERAHASDGVLLPDITPTEYACDNSDDDDDGTVDLAYDRRVVHAHRQIHDPDALVLERLGEPAGVYTGDARLLCTSLSVQYVVDAVRQGPEAERELYADYADQGFDTRDVSACLLYAARAAAVGR